MKSSMRALAMLLATATSPAWCEPADWIALPLGATQDLVVDASGDRTARFPARVVTAAPRVSSQSLQLRVLDVASRNGHGVPLAQAFHAAWVPAGAGFDPAITVTVPRGDTQVVPGTYALSLRLSPDFDNARLAAQSLTVTLTAPAPQLTADPVVVGRIIGLWPFETDESPAGLLRISEHGGHSGASALTFLSVADIPASGLPEGGTLAVTSPTNIGSNEIRALPVAASGPFPVGRSSGRIEVRSPDLPGPLSTTYEVRVMRSATSMIPIVLAGFLLGYLIRVWLARAKARSTALLQASDAVASIEARLAVVDDESFRARAAGLREALQEASVQRDPDEITRAATETRARLAAEVVQLESRIAPLQQQASALQDLVDRPWKLPGQIAEALAPLRADVEALWALLARANAGAAVSMLATRIGGRLAAVTSTAEASGAAAARWMQTLASHVPPLSDEDARLVAQSARALAQRYPGSLPDVTACSVDDVTAALGTYIGLTSVASKLLAQLPELSGSFTDWAASRLGTEIQRVETVFGPLAAATRATLAAIPWDAGLRGGGSANGLAASLAKLRDEWMASLHRIAPAAPFDAVEKALEQGSWEAAVEAFRATASDQFMGRAEAPRVPASATATAPAIREPVADGTPAGSSSASPARPVLITGTLAERARLLRSAEVASWLQSLLLALLFLVGNYFLYRESWVGTDKEIVTLFLVAFGLDLSADSVLGALKKA